MTFTAIATGIFAVAKAVPQVMSMFDKVTALIFQWRMDQVSNDYSDRRKKVNSLIAAISKASTNEERKQLSKILSDYTSGNFNDSL